MSREIEGSSYKEQDNGGCFVGSVPLVEDKFDDINLFFIRQKISIDECDVLIRSQTLQGQKELAIPCMVNKFLKDIDCKLTLSLEQ